MAKLQKLTGIPDIIVGVRKICSIAYPPLTLVLWYFYIWFLYGILIIRRHICASYPT